MRPARRMPPRNRNLLETLALAGPLIAAVILGLLIPHVHVAHEEKVIKRGPDQPEQYSVWEAFGKGLVSINYSDPRMTPGSGIGGFRIENRAPVPVVVPASEFPLILSPNPLEFRTPEPEEPTTQDAILTPSFIPPGSNTTWAYGSYVTGTDPPEHLKGLLGKGTPYEVFVPWWCAEKSQFTAYDAPVYLAGQTVPRPLVELATRVDASLDKIDDEGLNSRQRRIWDYLNDTPTLGIGKKPLVTEVEPKSRSILNITLAATNIGFTASGKAIVADVVAPGFGLIQDSFAPAPDRVLKLLDGGQRIEWVVPFPAAVNKSADTRPTQYFTQFFTYQIVVPELDFGTRYFLPSAIADATADGDWEARSAQPLIESVQVIRLPPEYDFPAYPWWLFVAMVGATFAIAVVLREMRSWEQGAPSSGFSPAAAGLEPPPPAPVPSSSPPGAGPPDLKKPSPARSASSAAKQVAAKAKKR